MLKEEVKSGWRTTEFWKSAIVALTGIGIASGLISPDQQSAVDSAVDATLSQGEAIVVSAKIIAGAIMAAVATFGYSGSRGKAKGAV